MSIEEIKEEIAHCEYCIRRIQQNMLGELLANYGNRTTGHSNDNIFLQEYIDRKAGLEKKLKEIKGEQNGISKNIT